MLKALRRPKAPDIERAAGELPMFWPQFAITNNAVGGGNPLWPQFAITNNAVGGGNPLHIPAFFRGMKHRTTLISTLPLHAEIDGTPIGVPIQLLEQPDPTEDRQTTLASMAASLVLRGEVVAVLGAFDSDGYPQALKVVDPGKATLNDDGSWKIGPDRTFSPEQIMHVVPLKLPGESRGVSVVELFKRLITAEIAAQEFQGNFYLSGGQATTILRNSDTDVTPEDLQGMLERYRQKIAGGNREPIVLPDTIAVETIGLSNSDAQFLESRQFAITDIANIVGVPPYLVGAPGSSSVYSNDFEQRRSLLDTYLRDDMYAIERAFSNLLPDGIKAKFDTRSFLRLDPKGTAEVLQLTANLETINEQRAVLGRDPLPGGDALASAGLPGSTMPAQSQEASNAAV